MNDAQKSLLNVALSILAPVLILEKCSLEGPSFWQIGTTPALIIALALPITYGIYNFATTRKADALNILGLAGVIFTAVVTLYATTGENDSIRPNTPWWYAAKEAFIPMILAVAMLVTARGKGALLRVFLYTDSIFHVERIEAECHAKNLLKEYNFTLWNASCFVAASLVFSSAANFFLSLYFLLPVLDYPAAEQGLQYNYALGSITWWGYLIIGIALMMTLAAVLVYLLKSLSRLTGMTRDELFFS